MRKQVICIMILVSILSLLVACGDKSNIYTEFGITPTSSVEENPEQGGEGAENDNSPMLPSGYMPTWTRIENKDMPYQYGNMFKSIFGAVVLDTTDKLLLTTTYRGTVVLMEYNKETAQVEPFCKLATCKHQTDDCPAGMAMENLDMRNGKLTVVRTRENNESWIAEQKGERFEFVAGPVKGYLQGENGNYYAVTQDQSLAYIDGQTNKLEILIDEFGVNKPIIIEKWIYAALGNDIIRVDLSGDEYKIETILNEAAMEGFVGYNYSTDGKYLYYNTVKDEQTSLCRCDLDGKNSELVLPERIYPAYLSFDEEYMYYNTFNRDEENPKTNGAIYRFPLNLSGEPQLLCDTSFSYPMVYVLPTSPDTLLLWDDGRYFFLPKSGGELYELEVSLEGK